jgi:acetyltransferase-like isoleucine patch superfamily enzyme
MSLSVRIWINRLRRSVVRLLLGRIVFGERSQGRDLPFTRIAPTVLIEHESRLMLGDHVYIGPFTYLEASGGITIGEGVQITSHVSIVTHSSHRAMRLLGRAFVTWQGVRPGWVAGPVVIGAYSFIGPHTVIEANTRLGRGTLVRAGSVVRGSFPDFAVLEGQPARVVGDTREADEVLLARHPEAHEYRRPWAG